MLKPVAEVGEGKLNLTDSVRFSLVYSRYLEFCANLSENELRPSSDAELFMSRT